MSKASILKKQASRSEYLGVEKLERRVLPVSTSLYHLLSLSSTLPPLSLTYSVARQYRGYSISRQRDTRAAAKKTSTATSFESFSPSRAVYSFSSLFAPRHVRASLSPREARARARPVAPCRSCHYLYLPLPRPSFASTLQFFSVSRRLTRGSARRASESLCEKMIPTTTADALFS